MNHNPWERELERCYATFDERHTQLRDELQTKLAERKSLHIHTEIRGRVAVTGLLRPSFVLAACLVVVVVAWLTSPLGIPRPAYGLDDLPKRLLAVRSVYMRGTNFFPRPSDKGTIAPATP